MATEAEVRSEIARIVTVGQGMKVTDVVPRLPVRMLDFNIPKLVEEMIRDGELVEVEYVLPELNWRAKSFLLPKGSTVKLSQPQETTT